MKWFGKAYGAPYEADCEHAATPVGEACGWCGEAIAAGDSGTLIPHLGETTTLRPYHYECQLRSIVGGYNHLRGACTCCGGKEPPDPPGMTKRGAAKLAATTYTMRAMISRGQADD